VGGWLGQTPVAALLNAAIAVIPHPTGGGQLADGAVGAPRIGDEGELEIQFQRVGIDVQRYASGAQAFQLAAKEQAFRQGCIIERLFAEAVAHQQQAAVAGIPDSVGEHAPQLGYAGYPFLLVQVDECFGVTVGFELMALADQVLAESLVVVDLTIEDHPDRAVFIRNGLMAGMEIDNAETAHADSAAAIDVETLVIGAAVPDLIAHGAHLRQFGAA
jgi:hypothetical protein